MQICVFRRPFICLAINTRSIRIRDMFEIQHDQIPKQRRGGCAKQHPCADFGDITQGAFLLAAEEPVDNQRGKCEKEEYAEKSAYHIGKWGGRLKKYGSGVAAWGRMFQRVRLLVRPCQKVMPFAI